MSRVVPITLPCGDESVCYVLCMSHCLAVIDQCITCSARSSRYLVETAQSVTYLAGSSRYAVVTCHVLGRICFLHFLCLGVMDQPVTCSAGCFSSSSLALASRSTAQGVTCSV